MKGKIAFVLGAAVGYVLGTRAGRERYEQIKRGAQNVWNTEPVQRGVGAVRDAAQGKVDELKASVVRAGKDAFAAFTKVADDAAPERPAPVRQAPAKPAAAKPAAGKSAAGKSSASTSSSPAESGTPVTARTGGADDVTVTEGGTA